MSSVIHLRFLVEPTPLNPERAEIRAPMPYVPRVGETVVFVGTRAAPRFQVTAVETLVHHYRWQGERLPMGYPEDDEDAALDLDVENVAVETLVRVVALESDARNVD